jgi:iron(III) transport system substrate-binding protein
MLMLGRLDTQNQRFDTWAQMTNRTPRITTLAGLVTLGLVAAACGGDDGSPTSTMPAASPQTDPALTLGEPSGASSVTIYSGRTEDLIQPLLDAFVEETGIEVRAKYGDSADLALLIDEEVGAGRVEADVFLSQSPGSLGFLDERGRLATLPEDVLELVPGSVRDDDGRWVGFSGRQRVLVYNPQLVDEADLPESVFELTDQRWNGQVGVAPSNGSFQDFVTSMRATAGDETTERWLRDLAVNDPVAYPKNSAIVAAVGRGEVAVGLVNHYYNYRALDEDPDHPGLNHQFAPGDPGSILIVTGASVVEGTDRADVAAQLIAFLLGTQGQEYFATETFEYPLAIGAAPAESIPSIDFDQLGNVGGIDFDQLGGGLSRTREMIADSGLEG